MLNGKNIAIVECEGIIALDIRTLLQRYGAENIWTFSNLKSFTNSLPEKKPHLLIVDTYEAAAEDKIRFITGNYGIPVIFLSDYPGEAELYNKIKNCFYLRKPFIKKELLKILDKAG